MGTAVVGKEKERESEIRRAERTVLLEDRG